MADQSRHSWVPHVMSPVRLIRPQSSLHLTRPQLFSASIAIAQVFADGVCVPLALPPVNVIVVVDEPPQLQKYSVSVADVAFEIV